MYKDFHYYGTYLAARFAGYKESDAITIAHAAQYVDDSTNERLLPAKKMGFYSIPTMQGLQDSIFEPDSLESREIWLPFHFLPGNLNYTVKYNGALSHSGLFDQWEYTKKAEELFKYICIPRGELINPMINDIIKNHSDKDYTLHLAGLRMHVLADSRAHEYFSGMPFWYQNEVKDDVYQITETGKVKIEFGVGIEANTEQCSPMSLSYTSGCYLGHARIGSIADYPWLHFKYIPQWNTKEPDEGKREKTRNNLDSFMHSFQEMMYALNCIRSHTPFLIEKTTKLAESYYKAIKSAISVSHPFGMDNSFRRGEKYEGTKFRCSKWKEMIKKELPDIKLPPEYEENKWYNIAKESSEVPLTDFYKYNVSAIKHRNFVKIELFNRNMSYWNEYRRVTLRTRSTNKKYICAENEGKERLVANRDEPGPWETFILFTIDRENNTYAIQACNNKFVHPSDNNEYLIADSGSIGYNELFTIQSFQDDYFAIKTSRNLFLSYAKQDGSLSANKESPPSLLESFIIEDWEEI